MLADPAKQRARDSAVAGLAQAILDVLLYALILLEVAMDEIGRLFRTDPQLLRQAERRLSVDDSKVHRFCALALFGRDCINRHA